MKMKNHMKMFWCMTFHTKLWLPQKPLRIRVDRVDEFIKVYHWTRYLVLFGPEK